MVLMQEPRELVLELLKPGLNATLVTDGDGLAKVRDFFDRCDTFGFDIETNITPTFFDRRIRTIAVGNRDTQFVIDLLAFAGSTEALINGQGHRKTSDWARPVVDTLHYGLESGKHLKVGVNLQFDYEGVNWCLGMRPWKWYDCLLAEKVIHCGAVHFMAKGFWAMDDMVERYCKLKINKELQKSFDLESPLTYEQIAYAALDTRLPLAIMNGQRPAIEQAELQMAVGVENGAISAFGDMHINGILLETTAWMGLVNETKLVHAVNIKTLDNYFVRIVGAKAEPQDDLERLEREWKAEDDREKRKLLRKAHQSASRVLREWKENSETYEGQAAINYSSNPQLLKAFHKMGMDPKKFKDTNDRTLEKFSEFPAVKAVQAYRKTQKILDTYGDSFIEQYVDPNTGRVHSHIDQLGAASGRTSSAKPNIQNILKGADWRGCFRARPGYSMITIDYNGCELRIMAEASGETVWVDAFLNNWDVHSVGAEILFVERWSKTAEPGCAYYEKDHQKCKCAIHKKLRDEIKAINFGLAYGMEAGKLADELGITKKAAQALLDLYRGKFKTVTAYLKGLGDKAKANLCARTLAGRRRLFKKPEWEKAKEIAYERAKKDGKDPSTVDGAAIGRAYYSMWGSIEREGKNTPIQGTNADIIKIAMSDGFDTDGKPFIWQQLYPDFAAEMVNMVHDEIVTEAPEAVAVKCQAMIMDAMERAGKVLIKKIPMTTEGHISDRWQK